MLDPMFDLRGLLSRKNHCIDCSQLVDNLPFCPRTEGEVINERRPAYIIVGELNVVNYHIKLPNGDIMSYVRVKCILAQSLKTKQSSTPNVLPEASSRQRKHAHVCHPRDDHSN